MLPEATQRISFNAITKSVVEALKTPRSLDQNLVHSYLARLGLDYLVGFTLSPVLWRKLPGCRSAAAQSVVLRIICEREREIEAFKPQEYWSLTGEFLANKTRFSGKLDVLKGKKLEKFSLTTEKEAQEAVKAATANPYSITDIETKQVQRHPAPPFMTSTLQQEASSKTRFYPPKQCVSRNSSMRGPG